VKYSTTLVTKIQMATRIVAFLSLLPFIFATPAIPNIAAPGDMSINTAGGAPIPSIPVAGSMTPVLEQAAAPAAPAAPASQQQQAPPAAPVAPLVISVSQAQLVVNAAIDKAKEINIPSNIAVTDPYGHLVAFARMDGAVLVSIEVAQKKARTVAMFGGRYNSGDLYNGEFFSFFSNRSEGDGG
jgi:Haem-degrading